MIYSLATSWVRPREATVSRWTLEKLMRSWCPKKRVANEHIGCERLRSEVPLKSLYRCTLPATQAPRQLDQTKRWAIVRRYCSLLEAFGERPKQLCRRWSEIWTSQPKCPLYVFYHSLQWIGDAGGELPNDVWQDGKPGWRASKERWWWCELWTGLAVGTRWKMRCAE